MGSGGAVVLSYVVIGFHWEAQVFALALLGVAVILQRLSLIGWSLVSYAFDDRGYLK